jgi:putative ABC transport system permease protein
MNPVRRVPLVWHNLTHHRRRLAVAICGIGFAVVLMFTELGFRNALFDSTVQLFESLNGDLILTSKAYYAVFCGETFSLRQIYQARACPGVKQVCPLYVQVVGPTWKVPKARSHPIRVLAFEPGDPVFRLPAIAAAEGLLRQDCAALFDTRSKSKYGAGRTRQEVLALQGVELSDRTIRLVGTYEMGTDFVSDGSVILSAASLAKCCPYRAPGKDPLSLVDLGIVHLAAGADLRTVQQQLRQMLPDDVRVHTKPELVANEIRFWNASTPIGYVFSLGMIIGFVVGVIICYQIIYADVTDHIPEFATLKAMGYPNRFFIGFVLQEAVCLSVLSFLPGLAVSLGLYAILAKATGLLMILNFWRAAWIFALTTAMCVVSGCLAMRKVLAADPASLF